MCPCRFLPLSSRHVKLMSRAGNGIVSRHLSHSQICCKSMITTILACGGLGCDGYGCVISVCPDEESCTSKRPTLLAMLPPLPYPYHPELICSSVAFWVLSRKEYVNSRQPCNEGNYLLSMEDCKPKLHIVHCNRVSLSLPSLR